MKNKYVWLTRCTVYRKLSRSSYVIIDEVSNKIRGGSRAAATSKMERFVIIVNGFQPLTIITKRSILDVAAALDLPLKMYSKGNSNLLLRRVML